MSINLSSPIQVFPTYTATPVEEIVQLLIQDHEENEEAKAYFLLPEIETPKVPRRSRFRRNVSRTFSPLKTLYKHRGRKQVAHHVDKIGGQLVREDGTVNEAERAKLEKALNDKLLEKISHYDEEGLRYLKIYTVAAGGLILLVVGGTFVSSAAATSGTLTLPATGVAVGVAAVTALVGAIATAALFAYRVDAKRNYVLKGVAKVKLRQYQTAQQHKMEREVGRIIANLAIDQAVVQATGRTIQDCNVTSSKRKTIEHALLQSLIHQERETAFLRNWSQALSREAKEIAASPSSELEEEAESQVLQGMDMIRAYVGDLDPETEDATREILKQACTFQLAKAEAVSLILSEPAAPFVDLISPYLRLDEVKESHVHCKSYQVVKTLKAELGGPELDMEAELCQLKQRTRRERKKRRRLEDELAMTQQALFSQKKQIDELQLAVQNLSG